MIELNSVVKDVTVKEYAEGKYRCICNDCGKEYLLFSSQLRKRKTPFCQCTSEKIISLLKEDLRSKKFGTLIVEDIDLEKTKESTNKYSKRMIFWKCRCENCGAIVSKPLFDLNNISANGTSGCSKCKGINDIGKKYGRLTVIEDLGIKEKNKTKERWIKCQCDCGKIINLPRAIVISGNTSSCGCLKKDSLIERNKRNAKLKGDSKSKHERLYNIWNAMKNRCNSSSNIHYSLYGGRGISVCKEWEDWFVFKDWALTHGYTNELTIDRIDGNGNYCPDNCRWVSYKEQANNISRNKIIEYNGKRQTLSQWCDELDLNYNRVKARLNTCNYTIEEAFTLDKYELRSR